MPSSAFLFNNIAEIYQFMPYFQNLRFLQFSMVRWCSFNALNKNNKYTFMVYLCSLPFIE